MLADRHAAEDAFQVTFLVLARRAVSVAQYEKPANWLYGVAVRTAKKARRREARRVRRESVLRDAQGVEHSPDHDTVELLSVLDEELSRLPGRYRTALLACEIDGKSRRQAAIELGVPEGTLSSNLSRGRKLLRERLNRRGAGTGAWPLGGLARDVAVSEVPPALAGSTAQAALGVLPGMASAGSLPASVSALMQSVGRSMFMTRLMLTAGSGLTLGALALAGALLASGDGVPMHTSQNEAKPTAEPRVSSTIEGETLRMNIDVPLDRVNPDTVILRGQGRQVEIAVGPKVVRRFEGHTGPVTRGRDRSGRQNNFVGERLAAATGRSGSGTWPAGRRSAGSCPTPRIPAPGHTVRANSRARHGPLPLRPTESMHFRVPLAGFSSSGTSTPARNSGFSGHNGTIYALAISPDGRRAPHRKP